MPAMHFFTDTAGGNMMNYVNLFWLFGHPEVYILILPAFGVYSEVISAFSSKELYGYTSLVHRDHGDRGDVVHRLAAPLLHHGAERQHQRGVRHRHHGDRRPDRGEDLRLDLDHVPRRGALHAVDGAVDGLHGDIRPRRLHRHHPGHPAARLHDAQHAVPGGAFPQYGHPRHAVRDDRRLHVLVSQGVRLPAERALGLDLRSVAGSSGFYLAFMPLYVLGAAGMARRTQSVSTPRSSPGSPSPWSAPSSCSPASPPCSCSSTCRIRDRAENRVPVGDPWDARWLEWSVAAPPPEWNFATIPHVGARDAFYWRKRNNGAYQPADRYSDIELPKNRIGGVVIGFASCACAFGLVWHHLVDGRRDCSR